MRNRCRYIFTAYGHKVYIFESHIKIIYLDTGYDITCTYDQLKYHVLKKVMPTINDLIIFMIKKLIA